jgi:hypothetical protein
MRPQAIANIFLGVLVPVAKSRFGENWLKALRHRWPMPDSPLTIGFGLSDESAKQILNLGKEAADYFEGLVWLEWAKGIK